MVVKSIVYFTNVLTQSKFCEKSIFVLKMVTFNTWINNAITMDYTRPDLSTSATVWSAT